MHLLGLIQSNAPSNFRFGFRQVGEVGAKRVIEAKSQIHSLIRNAYRLTTQQLALEDKSVQGEEKLSCLATACVVHNSGQTRLFDTVGTTFESVSLEVNGDDDSVVAKKLNAIARDDDDLLRDRLYFHRTLANITMSLDQYARFVRADNTEVPCTIRRVGNYVAKEQVVADKRESLLGDLKSDGNEILSDLLMAAKKASSIIEDSGARSASDRNQVIDICLSLSQIYDQIEEDLQQHSQKVTEGVMSAYQDEINQYKEGELALIPPSERQAVKKLLDNN